MTSLAGQSALVTGGGSGVGRGIALALAAEGASVTLAGRTLTKCQAVAAEILERGGDAIAVACDVKVREDLATAIATAVTHFGGLQILVNNAQQAYRGKILDVVDDQYRTEWESGPLATLRAMQLAHAHLAERGGVVINLASHAGVKSNPSGAGTYAGVKEEIRALTRAAAWEWAPDKIRCLAILPLANTPSMEHLAEVEPETIERVLAQIPQGRLGDPEVDIGRVVAFLVSPAASYLTGISIPIDGGAAHLG